MSKKRHNFKHPIQFLPRSFGDLLKDDPGASKNVIVPLEPESWKNGVYFNDDYDYEQHFVTLEDFNDLSKDLPKIDYDKKVNMLPSMPTNTAKVISEFEITEDHPVTEDIRLVKDIEIIKEIEKKHDDLTLEKLRELGKNEIDEEILYALQNAKFEDELSEDDLFPDNFIELANMAPNNFKCDMDMMNMFFSNNDEIGDNMDDSNNEPNDIFNFSDNIKGSINEISSMQYDYGDIKKMKLSDGNTTSLSTVSLSFVNALERYRAKQSKTKDFIRPIDEDCKKFIKYDDTDYDENATNKAVSDWAFRDKVIINNALDVHGKVSKIRSIEIRVEKIKKKTSTAVETMDTCSVNSDSNSTNTYTEVSQCHVPRPLNESSNDKKNRKRKIKDEKRRRQIEKKELKNAFAAL